LDKVVDIYAKLHPQRLDSILVTFLQPTEIIIS